LKSNLPDDLRGSHEVPPDVRAELLRVSPRLGAIAHRVHWLSRTGSTNDVASRLAELGAAEGTVVVAESQTSGRGRHGRVWFSPAGAGLYVSVILRPSSEHPLSSRENPAMLLTLASGVAIAEGVRTATGLPAEIKWPNDVMIGRRKLAGVLAEAAAHSGVLQFIVLGFGVNLQPVAYPPELASRATSIGAESGRAADRALILAEILAALAGRYADLLAGRFDAILSVWRQLAPSLPSAPIEWDSPHGLVRGRAEGIDEQGALLVRIGERVERLIAGEVRWM
jgi:BirA family biotin operon repressor/biotin-[acetyl-CoA-carboxylase] ligase